MLVVGMSFVAGVADFASGIVIAPFVLTEAWMQRRARRALADRGRFTPPDVPRHEPEGSDSIDRVVAAATCPNGHEIQPGAKYCPECGVAIPPTSAPEPGVVRADAGALPVVSVEEPSSIFVAPRPRRRRKRLLIGGGIVALAVVGIVAATSLSSGNDKKPPAKAAGVVPTKPKRKLEPAPTRYPQLLPAGMTKQRAAAPLCSTYKATIARWQQAGQERTAAMQGVSSTDPYASADFMHEPGTEGRGRTHGVWSRSSVEAQAGKMLTPSHVSVRTRVPWLTCDISLVVKTNSRCGTTASLRFSLPQPTRISPSLRSFMESAGSASQC